MVNKLRLDMEASAKKPHFIKLISIFEVTNALTDDFTMS